MTALEVLNKKEWHYTIVENAIIDDTEHFDKVFDKLVYIVLCRFANRESCAAHPSVSKIARMCGCADNTVRESLKRLEKMGLIKIQERKNGQVQQSNLYFLLDIPWLGTSPHEGGTSPGEGGVPHHMKGPPSHGEPELNKKNKKHINYTSVFESFWSIYPRKIGKKEAFKNWNTRLKEKVSPDTLILAATNYAKLCKERGTSSDYIMHPSTFLGPNEKYVDYISPPEPSETPKPSGSKESDEDDFLTKYGYRR